MIQQTGRVVVRVEVTDTGIGLTLEQALHLFQPFSQAHSSITRQYGGTGLGLAICKQLVELMGGQIGVESQPGQGSTFWFTACLATQPLAGIASPQPQGDLSTVRVLIVDDNATSRTLLQHLTASWGMQCASAEDGPQALALLRAAIACGEAYAVALFGLLRSGMDGLALAQAIKADPVIAATRLVLLTPFGQCGDAKLLHQTGVDAYLTKPVRQTQLRQCLATVMRIPPAGRQLPGPDGRLPAESTPHTAPLTTCDTLTEATGRSCPCVLVAEDNTVNQKVAVRLLEKLGYRADVVANGLEVLVALVRALYAAVMMDCHMPEMDGFEATREMRRREAVTDTQRFPIIAVAASAMQVDREKCLAAGMDAYISKPVQLTALDAVLQRWILPLVQGSLRQDAKNIADTCVRQGAKDRLC